MSEIKTRYYRKHPVRSIELNGKEHYFSHDIAEILHIPHPAKELAECTDGNPIYKRVHDGKRSFPVRLLTEEDTEKLLKHIGTPEASGFLKWFHKDSKTDEQNALSVLKMFLLMDLLFNPDVLFFPVDLPDSKGKEHADR